MPPFPFLSSTVLPSFLSVLPVSLLPINQDLGHLWDHVREAPSCREACTQMRQSSRQRFLGRHLQGRPGLSLQSPDEMLQSSLGFWNGNCFGEMVKNTADPLHATTATATITTNTTPPLPLTPAAAKIENANEEVRVSTFVYAPPKSPTGHSC